jgi:ureidoglycolate lyase
MNLEAVPLTASNFAPYGQVIELHSARQISINSGLTTRFHDLLDIDASQQGGRAIVNVFRTSPLPLPHRVTTMERHPLGSQAFIPMETTPFLVLVGKPVETPSESDLELFITDGQQGINLYCNTWHHFQIVLDHTQDFLVIDRGGAGNNLEEIEISGEAWIQDSVA